MRIIHKIGLSIGALAAIAITSASLLASKPAQVATVLPTNHPVVLGDNTKVQATSAVPTASQTPSLTPSPAATHSPKPTAKISAKPKPAATPVQRDLDFKSGKCEGINASNDECVTKDPNLFQIAGVSVSADSVDCAPGNMSFVPVVTATRHYLSGGGGDVTAVVDYGNGTSSQPVTLTFKPYAAGGANMVSADLPRRTESSQMPNYTVRVLSPSPMTLVQGTFIPCGTPSSSH